ncbi:hypothetical protein GPALN_014655 [Globodera pallida]|nr:hypothetical protein GPALN_014655 [Globodera pallida]
MENTRDQLDTYQPKLAHYLQALTDDDRATFIGHLQKLDFSSLNSAFKRAVEPKLPCAGDIQPIPAQQKVDRAKLGEGETERLTKIGLKAVAEGRVAAVVLAGGQASRLGSAHPKGVLRLGTGLGQNSSSPDSLLFIQATQIARLQRMARERFPAEANESGGHITWLVMTSGTTDSEIRDHLDAVLKETGLSPAQLLVFTQNEIPAFDFGGQAFLKSPSQLVTAPDGNGGFYDAICPLLPELVKRGVQHLHIYCVDNILCRVADPLMIGCAIDRGADCALKVIEKRDPAELVGHVCRVQELVRVLEYSEITRELAERRCPVDPSKLFLNAGSIANHVVTLNFLREACAKADAVLPYHVARKRIPFWDPKLKKTVQPTEPNGIKLERFIFDAFTLSKNVLLWQVPAEEEFSPLKNPESAGVDCLSTCLRALKEPHAQWIREACIDAQKKEETPNGQSTCHGRRNFPSFVYNRRTLVGIVIAGIVHGVTSQTEQEQKTRDLESLLNQFVATYSWNTMSIMSSAFVGTIAIILAMCSFMFVLYKENLDTRDENRVAVHNFKRQMHEEVERIDERIQTAEERIVERIRVAEQRTDQRIQLAEERIERTVRDAVGHVRIR